MHTTSDLTYPKPGPVRSMRRGRIMHEISSANQVEFEVETQDVGSHLEITASNIRSCPMCHKIFGTNNALNKHIQSVHTQQAGGHRLHQQSFEESFQSAFTSHTRIHSENTAHSPPTFSPADSPFESSESFQEEVSQISNTGGNSQLYSCHKCQKTFKFIGSLRKHIKQNHSRNAFVCVLCQKKCGNEYELSRHIQTHTGETVFPWRCKICDQRFQLKREVRAHAVIHETPEMHSCRTCGKEFSLKSTLLRHERMMHSEPKEERRNEIEVAVCSIQSCSDDNAKLSECRKMGIKEKPTDDNSEMSYKGSVGNPEENSTENSKRDLIENSVKNISDKNSGKYPCNLCQETFPSQSSLSQHFETHRIAGPAINQIPTGKTMGSDTDGSMHEIAPPQTKQMPSNKITKSEDGTCWICNICSKLFEYKKNLVRHYAKIHAQRPFSCSTCNESFSTNEKLSEHISYFEKKGTPCGYPCDKCSKIFRLKKSLREHEKFHLDPDALTCHVCQKKCSNLYNLKRHVSECKNREVVPVLPNQVCEKQFMSELELRATFKVPWNTWDF